MGNNQVIIHRMNALALWVSDLVLLIRVLALCKYLCATLPYFNVDTTTDEHRKASFDIIPLLYLA